MSKRRWSAIIIDNVGFELDMKNPVSSARVGRYGDIREAYKAPSRAKRNIFDGWWYWFRQHNGECAVDSKNCNFFTITGYVEYEGKKYQLHITPSHHYAYNVIGEG